MTLQGKVALVFGGSGSIGSVIVEHLLQHNAQVTAVGRRQERLDRLRASHPGHLSVYPADCTLEFEVQRCFREVGQLQRGIDSVIYTVAIAPDPDTPLAEYSLNSWRATLDAYATGFFLVLRESLKTLRPGGHIVAISSAVTRFQGTSLPPRIYVGHYAAAKAALDELCKWGRREAHERGLLLSRIAPGAVDTPFHRNAPPHRRPPALLPPNQLAERIVSTLASSQELDEVLVA